MSGPPECAAAPPPRAPDILETIASTSDAVGVALAGLSTSLARQTGADYDPGLAELALAEVLTNIVRHACAGAERRSIRLELWLNAPDLWCRVTDDGAPMPDGRLPATRLAPPESLPEGGFGWPLIRHLTRDLRYRRDAGQNVLSFRIAATSSDTPMPPVAGRGDSAVDRAAE